MIPSPSSLASRTVHHALLVHATRASPSVLTRPVRVREAQQRPTTRSQATLAQPRPSAGSTASARASASGEKASASQAASDSFQVHPRLQLTPNQVAQFQRDGFLLLERSANNTEAGGEEGKHEALFLHFISITCCFLSPVLSVLTGAQVDSLTARLEPLFAGEFDTGVYPDESDTREGNKESKLDAQLDSVSVVCLMLVKWLSSVPLLSLLPSAQMALARWPELSARDARDLQRLEE